MNRYFQHSWIGVAAGLASSPALIATQDNTFVAIALAATIGICFELVFHHTRHASMDSLMTGAAFGIPLWTSISIIIFPIIRGQMPQWTTGGMRALLPQLTGWVLYGASAGLFLQVLRDLIPQGARHETEEPRILPSKHVVILGGGFAGMSTAESLEHLFGADQSVGFTLVSETNALLFTPMLAEVAGSSLEPTHISSPLRTSLHRTRVIRGKVSEIDLEGRRVTILLGDGSATQTLTYDHLVLSLGSVSNYLGLENVQRRAFDFKSLLDAIRIRNHVIDMFERADREPDGITRKEILTFVVAGGGFAGVELAGALNDFGRGMLADYPSLRPEDLRVILVHSRDRILPELSEPLAAYALERMTERGVIFKLNARLADAGPGAVVLKPDEEIRAQTLVWTAGTTPNPLLKTLPAERDKRGAIVVDSALAVPKFSGVWALGDCAAVTDFKTAKPCPPTAQFALREARTVAKNISSLDHLACGHRAVRLGPVSNDGNARYGARSFSRPRGLHSVFWSATRVGDWSLRRPASSASGQDAVVGFQLSSGNRGRRFCRDYWRLGVWEMDVPGPFLSRDCKTGSFGIPHGRRHTATCVGLRH